MFDSYKTVFVPTEIQKSTMSMHHKPNGDQLARDIQATISEKVDSGYKLFSSSVINASHNSTHSYTSGVILIFELI